MQKNMSPGRYYAPPRFQKLRCLLRSFHYVANITFIEGVHHSICDFWTVLRVGIVYCTFAYLPVWMLAIGAKEPFLDVLGALDRHLLCSGEKKRPFSLLHSMRHYSESLCGTLLLSSWHFCTWNIHWESFRYETFIASVELFSRPQITHSVSVIPSVLCMFFLGR